MSEETIDYRKLAEALAEALEQRNLWIEGEEYRELVILRMRLSARVDSLAEELKAATARIAELEAEREWIPVSERLPELEDGDIREYDVVLTYPRKQPPERTVIIASWGYDALDKSCKRIWNDIQYNDGWGKDVSEYVTHWRERPTPPEVQE